MENKYKDLIDSLIDFCDFDRDDIESMDVGSLGYFCSAILYSEKFEEEACELAMKILDSKVIEDSGDKIDWDRISIECMSLDYWEYWDTYKDNINWKILSIKRELSKEFIKRYKEYLILCSESVCHYQKYCLSLFPDNKLLDNSDLREYLKNNIYLSKGTDDWIISYVIKKDEYVLTDSYKLFTYFSIFRYKHFLGSPIVYKVRVWKKDIKFPGYVNCNKVDVLEVCELKNINKFKRNVYIKRI